MKWTLLLIGIAVQTLVIGQSTLKIYVTNDDVRSDMDIIDLNTSSLERYGQSVDSTNIKYYATTMSTQVLRMSRLDLFGPEEELIDDVIDSPSVASMEVEPALEPVTTKVIIREKTTRPPATSTQYSRTVVSEETSARVSSETSRATKAKVKAKSKSYRLKKPRKIKRYKGQCPKFF